MEINASRGWYYRKCTAYNKKVPEGSSELHCPDHGPQPMANYGYCFKAIIDGGTAMATITCFSLEAHTFLPDCNDVGARPGDPDFNLDVSFKPPLQPLLSRPPPHPTTPPSPEILQQTTSNKIPTASESDLCPSKDSDEGSHTSSEAPKKIVKRELFKTTNKWFADEEALVLIRSSNAHGVDLFHGSFRCFAPLRRRKRPHLAMARVSCCSRIDISESHKLDNEDDDAFIGREEQKPGGLHLGVAT
ncbi:hypothetical protein Tco_0867518, partial [Tanacetum coccineum]